MNTVISDTLKNLQDQGISLDRIAAIEYEETPFEGKEVFRILKRFKIELINEPVTTEEKSSTTKFTSAEYHIICNAIEKCHGDKNEIANINIKMNKLVNDDVVTNERPKFPALIEVFMKKDMVSVPITRGYVEHRSGEIQVHITDVNKNRTAIFLKQDGTFYLG